MPGCEQSDVKIAKRSVFREGKTERFAICHPCLRRQKVAPKKRARQRVMEAPVEAPR